MRLLSRLPAADGVGGGCRDAQRRQRCLATLGPIDQSSEPTVQDDDIKDGAPPLGPPEAPPGGAS